MGSTDDSSDNFKPGDDCIPQKPSVAFKEEALQVLADLQGKGNKEAELVVLEFEEIRQQVYLERAEGAKSYMDLFKGNNPRRVMLGMSLRMWSQLSGMSVMMYYVVYVFKSAGITGTRTILVADVIRDSGKV
ncbi:MFS glucose transporter mfs1 [Psilocybe cubensis]|uniref:MFS glucose transporter mfs1 n=2 Tax=Psilocybe cubensis TaxID=181762 RepID=A0ACB8GJY2_PSICU|nr:MFS glucose transporter mfs1 [Psilocybe cubensis]KAH9475707.1 MFS glucose transporter mfs1 [Psilocybe cubensis]